MLDTQRLEDLRAKILNIYKYHSKHEILTVHMLLTGQLICAFTDATTIIETTDWWKRASDLVEKDIKRQFGQIKYGD